jgi:hypothetical protein
MTERQDSETATASVARDELLRDPATVPRTPRFAVTASRPALAASASREARRQEDTARLDSGGTP